MSIKLAKNLKTILHRTIIVPVNWMFKLTIPISEPERWHRSLASVQPFFCTVAFLLLTQKMDLKETRQKLAIGASIIGGIVIRLKTYNLKAPELSVFWLF